MYSVSLRIQSECGKMWTRINPNTDTFYAVSSTRFRDKTSSQALETRAVGDKWLENEQQNDQNHLKEAVKFLI